MELPLRKRPGTVTLRTYGSGDRHKNDVSPNVTREMCRSDNTTVGSNVERFATMRTEKRGKLDLLDLCDVSREPHI